MAQTANRCRPLFALTPLQHSDSPAMISQGQSVVTEFRFPGRLTVAELVRDAVHSTADVLGKCNDCAAQILHLHVESPALRIHLVVQSVDLGPESVDLGLKSVDLDLESVDLRLEVVHLHLDS